MSALHWAARTGRIDIVELLLNCRGINVNAADAGGWTPLHYAVHAGFEVSQK